VTFGILTRDIHDNNVVIPETSHTALEIVMEFRELPPDSKRKDAKGKKKPALIPLMIQMPDGASWPMEVLGNEAVVVIKRKVLEKEGIPLHQQRLIFNQKILEDNKAASDCGFGKDAVVVLELMTDAEAHDQVQAECTNLGKGIWQVDFPVRGYGQYCLQLKIGSAAVVKDIHRFSLEPPLDEPKGKAAQQKFLDEMQREIDDLKGKLGMTVVTKREEAADGTLSPAELSPDEG